MGSKGWTHGEAVLCDNREDLIIQCGDFHDCIIDEEVSEFIGYCKAMAEEIMFTLCDRQLEGMGCELGEVCKIGTIDPHIGVCMPIPNFTPPSPEEMNEEEGVMTNGEDNLGGREETDSLMGGDLAISPSDQEEGCQSMTGLPFPFLILMIIILGMIRTTQRYSSGQIDP